MLDALYNILALILPKSGLRKIGKDYNWIYLNTIVRILIPYVKCHHEREIKRIKKKEKIKVAFLAIHDSNWKLEQVYRKLEKLERFDPLIIVCPDLRRGENYMIDQLNKTTEFFKTNHYNVLSSFMNETNTWMDIKAKINPDIIFFINPHNITREEYHIDNFLDKLTCYVPYSVRNDHLSELAFNSPFQQLVWKNFYETPIHKKIAEIIAFNRGINVEVTGYPIFEVIINKASKVQKEKKTIIWAPHWTIEKNSLLNKSCFLIYSDFFIEFFEKNSDKINLVLRPHPFLKHTLSKETVWGKEKTEDFFERWKTTPGLSINEGDYTTLFAESDLLIHDSVSFLTEYLATKKPAIYTKRPEDIDPPMNEFGKRCLNVHYIVEKSNEIEALITNLLFKNQDYKQKEREDFFNNFIEPYSNASGKIVEILESYAINKI